MTQTRTPYWQDPATWPASKAAHDLARKVEAYDPALRQELHNRISALDANADRIVSAAVAERDAANSSLARATEAWSRRETELQGEVERLKAENADLKANEAEADSLQARQETRLQAVERKAGLRK